ncbi:uncharacterized protein NEMAJ01_0497 [Nematocida major]|uniref:uncharacterized protein n=1 Tax=Nematocida major TaxID=1912982 RepID=UPI002007826A|nr:uncharacterized protein NEMAJ01_0497 [Nematocida major]KAH9385601.1 hypothetical protein NEMAJ01_0497 [Nematocida major]
MAGYRNIINSKTLAAFFVVIWLGAHRCAASDCYSMRGLDNACQELYDIKKLNDLERTDFVHEIIRIINKRNISTHKNIGVLSCGNLIMNPTWNSIKMYLAREETMYFHVVNNFDGSSSLGIEHSKDFGAFFKAKDQPLLCMLRKTAGISKLLLATFFNKGERTTFAINTHNKPIGARLFENMVNNLNIPKEHIWQNLCVVRNVLGKPNLVYLEYLSRDENIVIRAEFKLDDPLLDRLLFLLTGGHFPESHIYDPHIIEKVAKNLPMHSTYEIAHMHILNAMEAIASTFNSEQVRKNLEKVYKSETKEVLTGAQVLVYRSMVYNMAKVSAETIYRFFDNRSTMHVLAIDGRLDKMYLFKYNRSCFKSSEEDSDILFKPKMTSYDPLNSNPSDNPMQFDFGHDHTGKNFRISIPSLFESNDRSSQKQAPSECGAMVFIWNDLKKDNIVYVQVIFAGSNFLHIVPYRLGDSRFQAVLQTLMRKTTKSQLEDSMSQVLMAARAEDNKIFRSEMEKDETIKYPSFSNVKLTSIKKIVEETGKHSKGQEGSAQSASSAAPLDEEADMINHVRSLKIAADRYAMYKHSQMKFFLEKTPEELICLLAECKNKPMIRSNLAADSPSSLPNKEAPAPCADAPLENP